MSVARHHAEWLSLVEVSGPFLSMPVLLRAFPDGLDQGEDRSEQRSRLSAAHEEWLDNQDGLKPEPAIHRAWIRFVLREILDWDDELLLEGQAVPAGLSVRVAEQHDELRPDLVLDGAPGRAKAARLLVSIVPRAQKLDAAQSGARWKASPAARMMTLLHGAAAQQGQGGAPRLGLVTNGEHWMLVHAAPGETTTYASFYASLLLEEPITLQAFSSLLGTRRLFGVPDKDTLEALFAESGQNQQEVTDQLGAQVRRAVEVLIQTIDRIDRDRGRALLRGFDEKVLYEAAVTVMMRLVFLFAAEERDLLLLGDPLYDQHYAVSTLRDQLNAVAEQHGKEVLARRHDAWSRLLATFRAVFGGVRHESMRLPAYGGSLFDPDRFPFLEGRTSGTSWRETAADPLPIDNLTVLDLLTSLQMLAVKIPGGGGAEARRLSFRALDVEQIGHVYEGLLDHTAKRARTPVVSLRGTQKLEPEIEIERLDALKAQGEEVLLEFVKKETGRSASAVKKAIAYEVDDDAKRRFLLACDNKEQLYERVAPWAGLVREDQHGLPVVFDEGAVYVTEGMERRATGTHYTPKSLTEPIVQYTLEPLVYEGPAEGWDKEKWRLKSARELLELRVCDLAMGSGAFLVQACRYLSQRLVEAWEAAESAAGGKLVVTPEGDLATGAPNERPLPRDTEERLAIARRTIADRCLYGVDKNPMAVEMAKLSLWLVTLQKDKPFTFVDHALRCGDSLLGLTSIEQLTSFHLDPSRGQRLLFAASIEAAVARAAALRRQLASFSVESIEDAQRKEALLREADAATADLRVVADLVIGAALATAGKKESAFDEELRRLSFELPALLADGSRAEGQRRRADELRAEARRLIDAGRGPQHAERRTFHWGQAFPEVFSERGGFDAWVGNPPFLGGKRISTILSTPYERALKRCISSEKGAADICAFFLVRASGLANATATAGYVATNTIGEGDTRDVGTATIVRRGGTLYRCNRSVHWPGSAAVEVVTLWFTKRRWVGPFYIDGAPAKRITSFLSEQATVQRPRRLAQSVWGSKGTYVHGAGFVLSDQEAQEIYRNHPADAKLLKRYLGAQDFTGTPGSEPTRWVIDFGDMPMDDAVKHRPIWRRLVELVKPQRDSLTGQIHEKCFWKHWDRRTELYARIETLETCIVCPETSKYPTFALARSTWLFSHGVNVIPSSDLALFAILQSTIHACWAWAFASTMRRDLRYTISDCLATFPVPTGALASLRGLGQSYHEARRKHLLDQRIGLTKFYNQFHQPGGDSTVSRLRSQHAELDHAVAAAYGWTHLDLGHGFHETKQGVRFTISEPARQEVLERLLALNHERYEEEVRQGLHDKKAKKGKAVTSVPSGSSEPTRTSKSRPTQTALDLGEPPPPQIGFDFDALEAPGAPAGGAADALSPDAAALVAALRASPTPLGRSALLKAAGVPDKSWTTAIGELKSKNLVTQQGERRGARYAVAPTPSTPAPASEDAG